jgi:hypothetical protein
VSGGDGGGGGGGDRHGDGDRQRGVDPLVGAAVVGGGGVAVAAAGMAIAKAGDGQFGHRASSNGRLDRASSGLDYAGSEDVFGSDSSSDVVAGDALAGEDGEGLRVGEYEGGESLRSSSSEDLGEDSDQIVDGDDFGADEQVQDDDSADENEGEDVDEDVDEDEDATSYSESTEYTDASGFPQARMAI